MRRTLPCALLLLAGCTCQSFEPDPVCQTAPLGVDAVLVEGKPGTVRLGVGTICFTGQASNLRPDFLKAKEVIVTVSDPDNREVAFTATAPKRVGDQIAFDTTTDVTFTPDRPGTWTVTASFEPGVGKAQHALAVATVRSDAGVTVVPTDLPSDCGQYALLSNGALACLSNGTLALGTARWPGSRFVVDGTTVVRVVSITLGFPRWQIDRLAPDAGDWLPVTGLPLSAAAPLIAARDGTVWVVQNVSGGADVFQCPPGGDGGCALARTLPQIADQAIAVEGGVVVAAHPVSGSDDVFLGDGGILVPSGFLFAIPTDGGPTQVFGAPIGVTGVWADEGRAWIFGPPTKIAMGTRNGPSRITAADLSVSPPRLVVLSVALSALRAPGVLSPAAPVLPLKGSDQPGILTLGASGVGYEIFDPGAGYAPVGSATSSHAFARSIDQKTLKIFDR